MVRRSETLSRLGLLLQGASASTTKSTRYVVFSLTEASLSASFPRKSNENKSFSSFRKKSGKGGNFEVAADIPIIPSCIQNNFEEINTLK